MKKLFFYLILLLIATGFVIHFGMVRVTPGSVTVVHSNISGVLSPPYSESGFNWTWQRLIPGDTKLFSFPIGDQELTHNFTFLLPPGKWPGITQPSSFAIQLAAQFQLAMTPNIAGQLVQNGVSSITKLKNILGTVVASAIQDKLATEIKNSINQNRVPNIQTIISKQFVATLQQKSAVIAKRYSIKKLTTKILYRKLPDMRQYLTLMNILQTNKKLFLQQINAHIARENRKKNKKAGLAIKIEELKKVAQLITKYPKLLDYLAVSKLSDKIRLGVLANNGDQDMLLNHFQKQLNRLLNFLPAKNKKKNTPPKNEKKK